MLIGKLLQIGYTPAGAWKPARRPGGPGQSLVPGRLDATTPRVPGARPRCAARGVVGLISTFRKRRGADNA